MPFNQISPKLNIEEIKLLGQLEGEVLVKKKERDLELANIIKGIDQRFLLIIGPCSSDNEAAVLEYAKRLAVLQEQVKDKIFMVMRVYTAKPRTNGDGYKGMIHYPDSSGLPNLINGIQAVRELHYNVITQSGLTTADEMLYPENFILIDDLVSYHAIGARSVENQQHRFAASGIDAPVGMKNPTSGSLTVLFNSIYAAQHEQDFLFNHAEVETTGNPLAHAILRGGVNEYGKIMPNYYMESLRQAISNYQNSELKNPFILIDTNHDNSAKQHLDQIRIVRQTIINRAWSDDVRNHVRGFMIESYLEDGRQNSPDLFGKSITDPCLGWDKTVDLVSELYDSL